MVSQRYPSELQLNKTYTSDTKATFLDLHLSISYVQLLIKFMIKVTILILKMSISLFWIVMRLALHPMESISLYRLLRFPKASSHFADFNTCNKFLIQKFLEGDFR